MQCLGGTYQNHGRGVNLWVVGSGQQAGGSGRMEVHHELMAQVGWFKAIA